MKNAIATFILSFVVFVPQIFSGSYEYLPLSPAVATSSNSFKPIYSQSAENCPRPDCQRSLEICKSCSHSKRTYYYCPTCDGNCRVCRAECPICFGEYSASIKEVILTCDHHCCSTCLELLKAASYAQSQSPSCPICRGSTNVKGQLSCGVCQQVVLHSEKSKKYTCNYRRNFDNGHSVLDVLFREKEEHLFHDRCITELAIKTAFRTADGKVMFRCPASHRRGYERVEDLYIPLTVIAPPVVYNYTPANFPPKSNNASNVCEMCHRAIGASDAVKRYKCTWLVDYFIRFERSKEHIFHDVCLKAYAERNAHKKLNGPLVFQCPGSHEGGVVFLEDIEKPLFIDYKAYSAYHETCAYPKCRRPIDPNAPDTAAPLCFKGYYPTWNIFDNRKINEVLYLHKDCLQEHIDTNLKKTTYLFSAEYYFPCPLHQGTDLAHDYPYIIPK